jgi:CspA family cold shock protein
MPSFTPVRWRLQGTAACLRALASWSGSAKARRGPQVIEVIEVDASSMLAASTTKPVLPPRPSSDRRTADSATEDCVGSVKWYNIEKGFGFVGLDDGGKDVFVHATTLERCGLNGLTEGQRVRMKIGQGQKGREARSIERFD